MKRKLLVGDLFEVNTPKGKGFIQYVYEHPTIGQLIRVISGLYPEKLDNYIEICKEKERFFIHFPLKAAQNRRIVNYVGNFPIPEDTRLPKRFRTDHYIKGEFICWHIVNYDDWKIEKVKNLDSELIKLSPWGIWNDTLLIERLIEEWSLMNWNN